MKIETVLGMKEKFDEKLAGMLGHKPSAFEFLRYSADMALSYVLYHATISDYFELSFPKKKHSERKEYWTSADNRDFAELVDPIDALSEYASKTEMYQELHSFIKRDQLYTSKCSREEFDQFISKHEEFLYKPDRGDCGNGIEVWRASQENADELYKKAVEYPAVLDEMISQHPEINRMCERSVNTIRMFSLRIGADIHLIAAAFRMGNGKSVVDNYSAGGIVAAIDMETGRIVAAAEDSKTTRYERHPYSGVEIKGFQIPNWDMVKAFVTECAKTCRINYIAWDIAVRQDDCVLIEANPRGMIHVIQAADGGGKREQYKALEKEFRENI